MSSKEGRLFVEIVRMRERYVVVCGEQTWIGFEDEGEARRFVERSLPDRSAVIVYREGDVPISYSPNCLR